MKKLEEELSHPQKILLRFFMMKAWDNMKNVVRKLHPSDLAGVFHRLNFQEQEEFLGVLFEEGLAASVITYLPDEMARDLLADIAEERIATMVQRLSADDATDFLGYLTDEKKAAVLASLPPGKRLFFEKMLLYEEDTAGGLMNTDYLALGQDLSVEEALRIIRTRFRSEYYLYVYVTDEHNNLIGVLSFRRLVFAEPAVQLKDIMLPDPVRVSTDTAQEEVAKLVANYDLLAVPVVDENNKLLGVVTVDDVIDVIEEEATEDMYHLAKIHSEENVLTPLLRTFRLRFNWVAATLVTAILGAVVVALFWEALDRWVWLAVLIPVLTTMTATTSTQTLTVVVRGLVLGELEYRKELPVLAKELAVGLLLGLVCGLVLAGVVLVWSGQLTLALLAGVSLLLSTLTANLFGALVPLVLNWLKLDPAQGSSIVTTTAANIAGFVVFLSLAQFFL
ncbi:MAG TPA: magnesium transporter [Acidobacteriota bacterium]|nr:magnesium transporter [Acidobacteriota bacterium]